MQVECPEIVVTGMQGEALCVDQMGLSVEWVPRQEYQVDLEAAAEPFSVGFLLMASCWALGKGVALVISLLRG